MNGGLALGPVASVSRLNGLISALPEKTRQRVQRVADAAVAAARPAIVKEEADRRRVVYAAAIEKTRNADADERFKALFDALSPDERDIFQILLGLAVERAVPSILQKEAERQREVHNTMCAARYRFMAGPFSTLDEMHQALDIELLRIVGELYLGDAPPSGAVRADVAVEFHNDQSGAKK